MSINQLKLMLPSSSLATTTISTLSRSARKAFLVVASIACFACSSISDGQADCETLCDEVAACEESYDVDGCYSSCEADATVSKEADCEAENDAMQKCWLENYACDGDSEEQEAACYDAESSWENCMGG